MLVSRGFVQSGIYVMRHDKLYMVVDCGRNGLNDWGGHAHNDTLSFELAVGQTTFLIDPGSYTYTPSREWHELFRSTAYHNTVRVDGQEINRFDEHDFWGLRNDAIPHVNHWQTTATFDLLDAQHTGYMRLKSPVLHRRQIFFSKKQAQYWVIRDILTGSGQHEFDLSFHLGHVTTNFSSSLVVDMESNSVPGNHLTIVPLLTNGLTATIEEAWRSPGYGQKIKSAILKYNKIALGPTEFVTVLWPSRSPDSPKQVEDQTQTAARLALEKFSGLPAKGRPNDDFDNLRGPARSEYESD